MRQERESRRWSTNWRCFTGIGTSASALLPLILPAHSPEARFLAIGSGCRRWVSIQGYSFARWRLAAILVDLPEPPWTQFQYSDAAGYSKVVVETVGVGQDEVEIVKAADVSVVVLVPGMGDDIQAIKAGIMEIGDIFVINKADREGVYSTEKELEALLSLSGREDGWQPPIIKTIATENKGIDDLAAAIESYRDFHFKTDLGTDRRRAIARWRILGASSGAVGCANPGFGFGI